MRIFANENPESDSPNSEQLAVDQLLPTKSSPRIITLAGDVNMQMVGYCAEQLAGFSAESDENILVNITSGGGQLASGYALYDLIATNPAPTLTVAYGIAGSSAALIFQAGLIRLMAPHAQLMIHEACCQIEGDVGIEEIRRATRSIMKSQRDVESLLAKRTKQPIAQIRKWCKETKTFSAKEAVRYGFADAVLQPRFRPIPAPSKKASK